ncbi:Non-specific lipid-transfer protein [Quillaja saponaria]|uniref:Non-specific lipid-transfer protein n=1 Tax=Quillaja saponaria TaxID=32244 RepID=A0AAD7M140_QUISA|nr:Non-specific lipid-transfer protein [Quillaja saponaria]
MEAKTMMGWFALACWLLLLVISAITCKEAIRSLAPCVPFLEGSGPEQPTVSCSTGAQDLFKKATTPETRRALCDCLKNAAAQLLIKQERAKLLPQLCKINLPVPIDPNINCST